MRESNRERYIRNPEERKLHSSQNKLRKRYGVTPDQYAQRLADQGGVCAVCGRTNANRYRLAVDHDHLTGKVRGLLCVTCNVKIGHIETPVRNSIEMAVYLGAQL